MERALIKIRGIVQGVGFRPFIHKLVGRFELCGYIKNTSSGVELELEGERSELESFVSCLPLEAPKLSYIDSMDVTYTTELAGFEGFEIRSSKTEALRNTLVSPDMCICDDCLRELRDANDRRYRYPFINCTNCGPRFTIIADLPYDRKNTSMRDFPMCPDCDGEYHHIENRRYHAQPNCCPDCGPQVFFLNESGEKITGDGIEIAREKLKQGAVIAVKGLGGMHLACRADDEALVKSLRQRKHRDEKPFALMCRDMECVKRLCVVSPEKEKILTGPERPIVLLEKRQHGSFMHISENNYIGIMLPYTPLHYLLFGEDIDMLVMTSANLSDRPIMYKNGEALSELQGIAEGYLLHNRDIVTRCDDSLCWVIEGREYFARRSRGYAPRPLKLGKELGALLACGAEQKASFCLSRGKDVFQSQHIGDLKNIETLENYEQQIRHFQRLFDIKPQAVACDMHPDYLSTAYARQRSEEEGISLLQVQHHHAHMASCMADNDLECKVIGLIWDGTGYGTDGTIWGGECLIGDYSGFERFGSIRSIAMPGGDKAVKEIYRLAFSLMKDAGLDVSHFENAETLSAMMEKGLNCPRSSGMGRLFDGVAAICGIKILSSYEGQGAVLLEAAAEESDKLYPISFEEDIMRFDWREMICAICADLEKGLPVSLIASGFMNTLIQMALEQCRAARTATGINDVVLSGGSFQNMYIMKRLPRTLEADGFKVWKHRRVSTNDEGIALGQMMILGEMCNVPCSSPETYSG